MFDALLNASRLALSTVDINNANRPAILSDELTESPGGPRDTERSMTRGLSVAENHVLIFYRRAS